MNKAKTAAIAALACTMVLGAGAGVISGCKKKDKKPAVTVHEDILNGGFETGDFTGWTASGEYAFDADGVVKEEAVDGLDVTVTGKVGEYYFNGLAAANATSTGALQSDPFTLGGTGKIGFKIGSGSAKDKCYVEFLEYGTDAVLAKVSNEAYDEGFIDDDLVRVVVDLSAHTGKNIYIKVTDSGSTQKSHEYLHLDDFVVYKTAAEVTAAEAERTNLIRQYGRPIFENDTPEAKTIKNGDFEDGLNNWLVLEGDAYTPRCIQPSSNKFWTTREYNAEGSYFLDGFSVEEDRVGAIRSTTFTLAETGIISFLMGNTRQNIYVAVCNEEAIGDIEAGTELFTVSSKDSFLDNSRSINMLRRYVDASVYTPEATEDVPAPEAVNLIGKKLYIKLVDKRDGGDFGAICLDDVRCSMTEAEVKALEKSDYQWAMALAGRGSEEIKFTQEYYTKYDYLLPLEVLVVTDKADSVAVKAGATAVDLTQYLANVAAQYKDDAQKEHFTVEITSVNYKDADVTEGFEAFTLDASGMATVTYKVTYTEEADVYTTATFKVEVTDKYQIMNGGFETGNLAGWEVTSGNVHADRAVSGADFGWSGASYNQGGSFHFDGANGAAVDEEKETYTLKSSEFELGGAGVISFKLGGKAAVLRVYEKVSGAMIAEYRNPAFADIEHAHVEKGNRSLTMTTYYADLSAFKGATLYIELADVETDSWAILHADDIVTYYGGETAAVLAELSGKADAVVYTCEGGEKTTDIAWVAATNCAETDLVQIDTKADAYIEFTTAQSGHDLTQYISKVTGKVIGVANPVITTAITNVSDGTTNYTQGFESFSLEAGKTYTVTYTLTYNDGKEDLTASADFVIKVLNSYEIQNGSFETGDLTGWTVTDGTAFADVNVLSETIYWGSRDYNQEGNYHLDGWQGAGESATGTIKSTTFTLGGTGKISFRLGGNSGGGGAYISVKKADGTEIARFHNTKQRPADGDSDPVAEAYMWLYTFDLTTISGVSLGDQLYIEIVDNATADWGLLFVDDIRTYHTDETFEALGTQDTDWFEATNQI